MLTKSWANSLFIFLSCDRQGADGYGPGRGYGRGMSGRTGGRGFGNGKFINYCPKFEFNFAVECKILKQSLLLLSRNGKENAATRIYMPSLQCSWYVSSGEYFVIIDGYGSNIVTSVYGFIYPRKIELCTKRLFSYSGHFIQHCPTNGDSTYDVKRVKPPTGIPKSMLVATPDGSYSLPSGAVAVLKPNEYVLLSQVYIFT